VVVPLITAPLVSTVASPGLAGLTPSRGGAMAGLAPAAV